MIKKLMSRTECKTEVIGMDGSSRVMRVRTFPTRITRKVPKCHERAVKSPVKKHNWQEFFLLYWKVEPWKCHLVLLGHKMNLPKRSTGAYGCVETYQDTGRRGNTKKQ